MIRETKKTVDYYPPPDKPPSVGLHSHSTTPTTERRLAETQIKIVKTFASWIESREEETLYSPIRVSAGQYQSWRSRSQEEEFTQEVDQRQKQRVNTIESSLREYNNRIALTQAQRAIDPTV